MSQPQMNHLRPDIVLIEYSDPGAEEFLLSTNTYALLNSGLMLLVDTNISSLIPFVRQLSDDGYSPSALVITHRHVVGLGNALGYIKSCVLVTISSIHTTRFDFRAEKGTNSAYTFSLRLMEDKKLSLP